MTNGVVSSLGSGQRACHCYWRTWRRRQRGCLRAAQRTARPIISLFDRCASEMSRPRGTQRTASTPKGQSGPQSRNIPFSHCSLRAYSPLVRPRVVYQSKQRGPELPPYWMPRGTVSGYIAIGSKQDKRKGLLDDGDRGASLVSPDTHHSKWNIGFPKRSGRWPRAPGIPKPLLTV